MNPLESSPKPTPAHERGHHHKHVSGGDKHPHKVGIQKQKAKGASKPAQHQNLQETERLHHAKETKQAKVEKEEQNKDQDNQISDQIQNVIQRQTKKEMEDDPRDYGGGAFGRSKIVPKPDGFW
jgi:hypothetical protein